MIPSRIIPRLLFSRTTSAFKTVTPTPISASPRLFSTTPSSSSPSSSKPDINPKDHLTANEAESKRIEESNTSPPGALARPLGVTTPPSTVPKSREQWRADLLSQTRRLTERKHLVQQVSKGYFHDYNSLRHSGGKTFMAPATLIREDLSLYFPNIEGVALSDGKKTHTTNLFKGKISLVVMSSFRSSEEHINSFVRPALADMKDQPLYQYVYINLQENPLKSFLVTMFLSSLRKTIPVPQQSSYLLSHQSLEYLREPMGMENKHVGYVFLVDEVGKIRWAGCSWATLEEEEALRKCSHVLVDRLAKMAG